MITWAQDLLLALRTLLQNRQQPLRSKYELRLTPQEIHPNVASADAAQLTRRSSTNDLAQLKASSDRLDEACIQALSLLVVSSLQEQL